MSSFPGGLARIFRGGGFGDHTVSASVKAMFTKGVGKFVTETHPTRWPEYVGCENKEMPNCSDFHNFS